jgi:hypothetical protein
MAIDMNKEIAKIRDMISKKYESQFQAIKDKMKAEIDIQITISRRNILMKHL